MVGGSVGVRISVGIDMSGGIDMSVAIGMFVGVGMSIVMVIVVSSWTGTDMARSRSFPSWTRETWPQGGDFPRKSGSSFEDWKC